MSLATIVVNLISLLMLSIVIFTQNIDAPIDLNVNQTNYVDIGVMFKYKVQNKIFNCERSTPGIVIIVFISFQLFFMFVNWLYFSFKIIKHKYIS